MRIGSGPVGEVTPAEPVTVPVRVEDLRVGTTVTHAITRRPARLTGVVNLPAGSVRLEFQYAPPVVVWRHSVALVHPAVQSSITKV